MPDMTPAGPLIRMRGVEKRSWSGWHFAREIADRVIFLEGGRIVEEGAPEAIFAAPAKERTRELLQSVLEA